MTNKDIYDQAFMTTFSIDAAMLNENLTYNGISAWDSIGHMALIAALEEEFDIMMETDDIIDLSSYAKGMEILEKYNVNF